MDIQAINIAAIIVSPIIAALSTLLYQAHRENREAKRRLFLTLMAHRKSQPIKPEWVEALNVIDVVFAGNKEVRDNWHQYYDLTCTKPLQEEQMNHKYLELLSSIATVLGYKELKQTDIDKFYSPQGMATQNEMAFQIASELLRVLREFHPSQAPLTAKDSAPKETTPS